MNNYNDKFVITKEILNYILGALAKAESSGVYKTTVLPYHVKNLISYLEVLKPEQIETEKVNQTIKELKKEINSLEALLFDIKTQINNKLEKGL